MPVYFIQSANGGPVKIGTSEDVGRRLKALEYQHKTRLVLLKIIAGGRKEERVMHERFAGHRIGRSELFHPGPDLMEFLAAPPILIGANPDTVEVMPERPGISIRLEADLVKKMRYLATARGESVMTFASRILRPEVDALFRAAAGDVEKDDPRKKG